MFNLLKLSAFILIIGSTLQSYGQAKSFKSSKNIVTKANGNITSLTIEKNLFFEIWLNEVCNGNDCGTIIIADGPLHTGKSINFDRYRIYSVKLKDDGIYNYWTTDIGNDGQTVLFQLDPNAAISTITMLRYAPNTSNDVLKIVTYYLD